ncbi:hypothetical protein CERZMDRAFT_102416 [Cercospora zeae-maydis SCOH1-5]|uniref:HNH nuclease domain-containing protein n=1 Tax=Cercospora zeae-maydis SCOH1-5 TaxID=717836 RepID=A0A6A6F243_9PEZI|nr:hypothetical protein CERZMDRAFT_102416 [Cercospora zeae-maydis SCOH1-5]
MQRVRVRHPGYNHPNILFMFPASDGAHRDHAHYATIWMACSIFIDNRQDHWLSSSTSGEPRMSANADGLIHSGDYFLHVPHSDTDTSRLFPIVPNFRAWRYPHSSSLLPLWTEASHNDEVAARHTGCSTESIAVERCRITNRKLEVDNAHIIPVSEKLWFTNNEMGVYGDLYGRSGEIIADSFANLLRLRCDAHRLWDKLNFSIVPRNDHPAENRAAWFTQALGDDEELHQYWHRQKLNSLAGRPPQYLLARFAWDIFPKLHEFLQAGQERQLTVWTLDVQVQQSVREASPATTQMIIWTRRSMKRALSNLMSTHLPLITFQAQTLLTLPWPAGKGPTKNADVTGRQRLTNNGIAIYMVTIMHSTPMPSDTGRRSNRHGTTHYSGTSVLLAWLAFNKPDFVAAIRRSSAMRQEEGIRQSMDTLEACLRNLDFIPQFNSVNYNPLIKECRHYQRQRPSPLVNENVPNMIARRIPGSCKVPDDGSASPCGTAT